MQYRVLWRYIVSDEDDGGRWYGKGGGPVFDDLAAAERFAAELPSRMVTGIAETKIQVRPSLPEWTDLVSDRAP